MNYALGIDIGSASLAAAVNDGIAPSRTIPLETDSASCPSALFFADEGVVVGPHAIELGLVHPERLVRGYLSRVGDDVPLAAGEYVVMAEDVVALVARWIVDRAEDLEGRPPAAISLAYPTTWGSYRVALLENALAGVGLGQAELVPAAVAAMAELGDDLVDGAGSVVAVYDLGEEFELELLDVTDATTYEPRAGRSVEALGGRDFDEAVFAHVSSTLHLDEAPPAEIAALSRVWQGCIEAKEALSFDSEVTIPVDLGDVHARVRMVRAEFEGLIDEVVRGTIETVRATISVARLEPEDLAAIVLIGGSSRVPLVAEMLSGEFGRSIVIGNDPSQTVSLGAATRAAGRLPLDPAEEEPRARSVAGIAFLRRRRYALAAVVAASVLLATAVATPPAVQATRGAMPAEADERGLHWPEGGAKDGGAPTAPGSSSAVPDDSGRGESAPRVGRYDAVVENGPVVAPGAQNTGASPSVVDPQPEPSPAPSPAPTPDPEPTAEPEPSPAPTPDPEPLPAPGDAEPTEQAG